MRVMRSLVLVWLAVGVAAGCNKEFNPIPTMPPPPTGALTETRSFTVHGQFNAELSTSPIDFILRIDPVGRSMIVGTPGSATIVALASSDGVSFRVQQGAVVLPIANTFCGSAAKFSDFQFNAGIDSISGTASGMAYIIMGDYGLQKPAQLDFKGVPDATPPSIVGHGVPVDPLDPFLVFTTSEPLPSSTQAQLISPNDRIALSAMDSGGNATVGFQKPVAALRYDTTYKIVIDQWVDLAGNPGLTPDGVTTFSTPPLIPGDGFESASDTLGGATIADATTFAPISGQKSVLVGASLSSYPLPTRFTARLAVAPGSSVVRFSLRPFTAYTVLYLDLFGTQARLAAPGGEILNVPLGALAASGTNQVTPSGVPIILGDTVEIEAPLPQGVADTVVFDFLTGAYGGGECRGAMIPSSSYQIDNLRVE